MEQKEEFSADKFVENLINEGSKIPCDKSTEAFNSNEKLPPFYDEATFKRGQNFFYRNIFGLFLSKLLGLITVLGTPSIQVLVITKMSGNNYTAYKRYLSTIFHMCIWYEDDFKPGSKLWKSIAQVKSRHNSASEKSCASGFRRINQKDMAFTQFGFMGFALIRSDLVGVHRATDEEWRSFIHIWRVVGHLLGIEDRFNICRESVEETKEICNKLLDTVFEPLLEQKNEVFLNMSSYLVNGLWAMNPFLEYEVFISYLYSVIDNKKNQKQIPYELNTIGKIKLKCIHLTMHSLQYKLSRIYHNSVQLMALWLMKVCPFLAYYRYGKENSHVKINL